MPGPPDIEVELIEEDTPPPSTQRFPILPPPPAEPFRLLNVKQPNNAQLMGKLEELSVAVAKNWATSIEVLSVQRKMARQTDGLGQVVNGRLDVFHREVALLRGRVSPGEKKEEKAELVPVSARAASFALGGGKYTVGGTAGYLALKVLATQWPWLDGVMKGLGL